MDLLPIGYLPNAFGKTFMDVVEGAAVAAEGLQPFAVYRAFNHVSGDCLDQAGVQMGPDFQADDQGVGGVMGDIQNPGSISIQDLAGIPVLCGSVVTSTGEPVSAASWGHVKATYR